MEIVSLWILRPIWFWEAEVQVPHQSHDVFNRVGAAADDPGSYGLTPTATSAEAFGQVTLRPSNKTNPAPSHNRVMGQHCQQTASELSPPLHLKVRGASSSSELHKHVDTELLVRMTSQHWVIVSALRGTQSLRSPREEAESTTSFLPAGYHT